MGSKKRRKSRKNVETEGAVEIASSPSVNRTLVLVLSIALVLLTFAVYWQVLGNDFINMDDDEYVTKNVHVTRGVTGSGIVWAFTTPHSSNWHPLTWVSHMLDCQLFGLKPWGHHLTGLIFHILNVILLFLLLSRVTGFVWRSAFVAALFAVHPLRVESVAWVAERKDVLSTMLWLLTMLAYVWYTRNPRAKRYVLVAVLFALGLMAKPMLVSLPLVLLLMDYWPLGRVRESRESRERKLSPRSLFIEKLPLFGLAAASCVVTFFAQRAGGAVGSFDRFPFALRVENALVSYVMYLVKMVWPRDMAVLYPFPSSIPSYAPLGAAIALVAITIIAFRARTARPYLVMGWLWYVITLIPVIGLVQVGNQAMADRYTYVPLIGVFIAIAWVVGESVRSSPVRITMASIAVIALAVSAYMQVGHWQNAITLFRHTIACTAKTNNYISHGNLAQALLAAGKPDEAIVEARRTVSMAPRAARPHDKLGAMLAGQGNIQEGMAECKTALEIDPNLSDAHYNLGAMYHKLGDIDNAIREYEETLRLKPDDAEARQMLAVARRGTGGSVDDLLKTIASNPKDYEAYYRLGIAYEAKGRPEKAFEEYRQAIRLKPDFAPAHNNLGLLLGKSERLDAALVELREAARLNPKSADTYCNIAVALSMQGKTDEAMSALRKAVKIQPMHAGAHGNLAALYFDRSDYASAWREIQLCRKYGGTPNQSVVERLSAVMPEPAE